MKEAIIKKSGKIRRRGGKLAYQGELWGMAALPVLWFIIFSYLPMFGITIAFKNYNYRKGIFGSEWVGLKNFEFFLKSNDMLIVVRNTILMNALFIASLTICALLVAIFMYNIRSRKLVKALQTSYITPNFVSYVMVAYVVYAVLNPQYGIANQLLNKLGIGGVDWYSQPKYWPIILTIVHVWKAVGMRSVMYYAALMGVDETLFEAAEIDGANKVQITYHILIPEILSIIVIMAIMDIGGIFRGDFGLFYLVTQDSPLLYSVTDVVDTYVYRTLMESNNVSLSTAIGFIQSVVGCIMVLVTNFASKKIDGDLGLI